MSTNSGMYIEPIYHDQRLLTEYLSTNWGRAFPKSSFKGEIGRVERAVLKFRLGFTTNGQVSSSNANDIPSLGYFLTPIASPIYSMISNYTVRDDDVIMAQTRGLNEAAIQLSLAKLAQFMMIRDAMFFGIKPNSNEGILNCANSHTAPLLITDIAGESALREQDNGEVAFAITNHLNDLLERNGVIMEEGMSIGFLAPQSFWTKLSGNAIEITSSQRPGAGSNNIWEYLLNWAEGKKMNLHRAYDDKLIGKGNNGQNPVIIFLHETPKLPSNDFKFDINGNVVEPSDNATISQYYMLPIENIMPQNDGGFHSHLKSRMTAGIAWNGNAVTVLSYSPN